MQNTVLCIAALLFVVVAPTWAIDDEHAAKLAAVEDVFRNAGIVGTLVVESADGTVRYTHNKERAQQRFSPASTFKVPNTLIALGVGIVNSGESGFDWDGNERSVPAWNQDHTLRSAFKVSCVWCYQHIARQVGIARYRSALEQIEYGNMRIGGQVDQFWLNDQLQVTAEEQVEFIGKVQNYSIPFRREHVDTLHDIMLDDDTSVYRLFAKTGWTGPVLQVGWYVGFVEKESETWIFAMNMRLVEVANAPLRKALTLRSLEALDIL